MSNNLTYYFSVLGLFHMIYEIPISLYKLHLQDLSWIHKNWIYSHNNFTNAFGIEFLDQHISTSSNPIIIYNENTK